MKKDLRLVAAVTPMPVILIATYNDDGTVDVMNAAWATAFDVKQVQLNISEEHKTTENIRRTKCFSIALADLAHMAEADYFGIDSAKRVKDKFERTGLKAVKGSVVNAPILEDFPLIMECELIEGIPLEYGVIGEVKRLAVEEKFIDDNGKVDLAKMKIIAFDQINNSYNLVGEKVGQAFSVGKKYKK